MKLIKKTLCLLLTMLIMASAVTTAMASDDIKVKIDGKEIAFDVPPQIIKGRTMVPLRAIFEALGATVEWDSHSRTVNSTKDGTRISLTVNYPRIDINGEDKPLECPPRIVDGRTLVPVRAISEAFNAKVEWVASERTVLINTNGVPNQSKPSEEVSTPDDSTLIYEDSKVQIKFLRVEKRQSSDEIKAFCEVKNKTNETLRIFCDALSFDGYCFNDVTMADDISAGAVATVDTIVASFDFSSIDIGKIKSFGGQFRIKSLNDNFETYNATFISKNLSTNAINKSYPAVTGKTLLYSDDKINMYFDYAEDDGEDFVLYLIVQNKTEDTILIQNNNVVVNGTAYKNTIMSDHTLAYTTGNVNITVKDVNIGSVSSVGGEFRIISDSDSFDTYKAVIGK